MSSQVKTLLPLSLCFGVTLLIAHFGGSLEVGCFLGGVIIKSMNRGEQTQQLIEPGFAFRIVGIFYQDI
jgi:Kef-type K+ transport system membrane component KefB